MTMLTDEDLRRAAKRRVDAKMGFYVHALVYVIVNLGLFVLNLGVGGQRWSIWPLLGWGIGLTAHGLVTFISLRGEGLRQRMLEAEMQRLRDTP